MPKSEVRLTLHGGETLTIAAQDVSRICESLFRLGPSRTPSSSLPWY